MRSLQRKRLIVISKRKAFTARLLTLSLLGLTLMSCQDSHLSSPSPSQCDNTLTMTGNAGCAIVDGQRLLVIQQRSNGAWSIPGGTADAGESAACTAWRETYEETGLSVRVTHHLGTWENGFHVFACQLNPQDIQETYHPPATLWGMGEVDTIRWIDPATLPAAQWRYPAQWEWLKRHITVGFD